ncbi:putative PHD type zinc finger protein with BAH domain-containing protein [Xanthoria parietina]
MADGNHGFSEEQHHAPPKTAPLDGNSSASAIAPLPPAPSTSPLVDPSPPSLPEAAPVQTGSLDSQPMTTTSPTPSTLPALLQPTMDDNGPSPYGTRSRNRGGNPRINYAEDRELDMDYDWTPASKKPRDSSTSASSTNLQTEDVDNTGVSTRRRSLTTAVLPPASKGTSSTVPKDQIPGLSSFPVHSEPGLPTQQPSKKRKAPGAAPATPSNPSATSGATSSKNNSRKAVTATPTNSSRTTNMLSFDDSKCYLRNGGLRADDGTVLSVNDHVYLVCEPPGEPYYLARIMEFLHAKNDHKQPIESLRVNWYYRPRDIGRKVTDTRFVFASMHSETCPITSLRGKCHIAHRHNIENLDDFRKVKDSFWYDKMFDRFIHRYYEVIPTSQVINVPVKVKKLLDERWKFVIVELGRGKELTSAIKSCKRCSGYCASNDSVDCAMCKNTYHMNCVRPPLLKKPARGFAWSCGPCSRKQERNLEARNIPHLNEKGNEGEEDEPFDEEEEEHGGGITSNGAESESQAAGTRPATAEQIAQAKLWPYRYLGIHCRVEDALDYDDRIYPRASSRLGPKHQANVVVWHGQPVELVKPAEIKRRYVKGGGYKKDGKPGKDNVATVEEDKMAKEKRPRWVMDEPYGYVRRGEDLPNDDPKNTAKVQFRMPEVGDVSTRGVSQWISDPSDPDQREKVIDEYMTHAKAKASHIGVKDYSTNFLDKALELLYKENFNVQRALTSLDSVQKRADLKEPELTKEELRRFEEGVAKYGSELRNVSRHVGKSRKHGEIVRFYYMWKKTPRGQQIWGSYENRKGKKHAKQVDAKLVDDVADEVDDSAFDSVKASSRKRNFECKFCSSRKSPQWRRAPGTAPGTTVPVDSSSRNSKDKGDHLIVALCQRCAGLWRKYGIQWENIDEVAKMVANTGGKAWRKKMDPAFLAELISANDMSSIAVSSVTAAAATAVGVEVPPSLTIQPGQEVSKKRQKVENQAAQTVPNGTIVEAPKKKPVEKPPEPLIPEQPVVRILPCAVCHEMGDQRLSCKHCRLTVHRNCYGIAEGRPINKWSCDTCSNDTAPQISTSYECVLCPVTHNEQDLLEPPKVSHKKKSDREREKERLEREMVLEHTEQYYRRQDESGRPRNPREPFKRTTGNRWVHVTCAVWHPEIKFSNAASLEASEGFQSIPATRYEQYCKLCKSNTGACINCHQCAATFHVACAVQYGYRLGFDITPVKGSRKDIVSTLTIGSETGNATPVVYCREHTVKPIVHPISEAVGESSLNALQLFVRTYKQADLSLTGTVRKAAMMNSVTRGLAQVTGTGHRASVSNPGLAPRSSRVSPAAATVKSEEFDEDGDRVVHLSDNVVDEPTRKICGSCGHDASPKWHKVEKKTSPAAKDQMEPADDDRCTQPDEECTITNGRVNGVNMNHPGASRDEEAAPGERDVGAGTNGTQDSQHGSPTLAPRDPEDLDGDLESTSEVQDAAIYLCHKCYLRNPTPPPATEYGMDGSQPEHRPNVVDTPSPPPPPPPPQPLWPFPPSAAAHDRYTGWPGPPPVHYAGPHRLANGIPPSPPSAPPPLPTHFPPPPGQYHNGGYRHGPSHHDMGPQRAMNGIAGPYHGPHSNSGHLTAAPYSPHVIAPSRMQHGGSGTRDMISPPMQHQQPMHGPHGPPRAEENPFAVPFQAHRSPRQDHQGIYGSPRGVNERPETPPGTMNRGGVWAGGDGRLNNGASESPSLRNLLH